MASGVRVRIVVGGCGNVFTPNTAHQDRRDVFFVKNGVNNRLFIGKVDGYRYGWAGWRVNDSWGTVATTKALGAANPARSIALS